jgi:hypothetical protein
MYNMAVSMDTFPDGACFFGNTLAGLVLHCRDYLKAREAQHFESKPADELYSGSCNTFPFLTRSDPIAKSGKVVFPIDLINGTAAKKSIVFSVKYDKVIFYTFQPHPESGVKP